MYFINFSMTECYTGKAFPENQVVCLVKSNKSYEELRESIKTMKSSLGFDFREKLDENYEMQAVDFLEIADKLELDMRYFELTEIDQFEIREDAENYMIMFNNMRYVYCLIKQLQAIDKSLEITLEPVVPTIIIDEI